MEISEFIEKLDFDEFDYFYHETSRGTSEEVMEEGLLVDGTNILDTDNILFTTALPLTRELVSDSESFKKFLEEEKSVGGFRDVSEMVILGAPKDYHKRLVSPFDDYKDGNYYQGIVESHLVLGYIDLSSKRFTVNENYEYSDQLLYDDGHHK